MPNNTTQSQIDDFFHKFGKPVDSGLTLPSDYSIEEQARLLAAHYDNTTQSGEGIFFEFRNCPELQKPTLNRLINQYNWTLENQLFIRKPEF